MLVSRYLFLLAALPCLPLGAAGQSVHRCENTAGHVTFTTLSCRQEETLSLQQIHPTSPGRAEPMTEAMLPEAEFRQTFGNKANRKEPTVVGQLEDRCGNLLNARQRREAIMNQRVVSGMSQQDVERPGQTRLGQNQEFEHAIYLQSEKRSQRRDRVR